MEGAKVVTFDILNNKLRNIGDNLINIFKTDKKKLVREYYIYPSNGIDIEIHSEKVFNSNNYKDLMLYFKFYAKKEGILEYHISSKIFIREGKNFNISFYFVID